MAKTLSQIRDDARKIIFQTDSGTSNFSDAQLNIWINDAYRKLAMSLESIPITTRDYTAASGELTLNSNTVSIRAAKIYDSSSGKFLPLSPATIEKLFLIDADFENAATGKPHTIARVGTFKARLYPPPDSDTNGQTLRIVALENPSDLSSDGEEPDLPRNLQDLLSHWAASRAFFAIGNAEQGTAQLTLFRAGIKEMKGVSTEFSPSIGEFIFSPDDDDLS